MHACPRLATLVGGALLACAHAAPPRPSPAVPAPTLPSPPVASAATATTPALTLRFSPRLDPTPRLAVEISATGIAAREWQIAALVGAELQGLRVDDDRGPLPHTDRRDGVALRVTLARAPVGPLRLAYALDLTPPPTPLPAGVPPALLLRIDNERVLASGEEALLLPLGVDGPLQLRLRLDPVAPRLVRLASSLGVEPPPTVRADELRHAVFLIGETGRAVLRGPEGADDFAWTGAPGFDLRWSAAETAGARTAVDLYFGAADTARFTGVFAVDIDYPGGTGALVMPRSTGLYVAISPGARWDARARLAVAQGLVHRWIGGRLRLRDADAAPGTDAWFTDGVARFVAREVLFDLGTLSADDYADELNLHQAELATAPLRAASNAEVAAAASAADPEVAGAAQALLIARGALYATRLDAAIRARTGGGRSLRDLLRGLVARAREAGRAELPLAAFTDLLAAELGPAELAAFRRMVLEGAAIALPADALGPCFTRGPRVYTRFELGLDAALSRAETPGRLRGVRPGGPAARAGVREGERFSNLSFTPGEPTERATATLERGGRYVDVTWRPIGAVGRGEAWRKRPNVDEARCLR